MFSHYCYSLADPYTHAHSNSSSLLWAERGATAGTHRRPDVCRDYKNRLGLSKTLISPPFLHCSSQNKHIISRACWGLLATEKERKIERDGEREKENAPGMVGWCAVYLWQNQLYVIHGSSGLGRAGLVMSTLWSTAVCHCKMVSRLCLERKKVSISTQERIASGGSSVPTAEGITFLLGKQRDLTVEPSQKSLLTGTQMKKK